MNTPGYCLKLPGKQLNLSALLYAKKFRAYGYKSGAVDAFKELEAEGLGVLEEVKAKAKTVVRFTVDACYISFAKQTSTSW